MKRKGCVAHWSIPCLLAVSAAAGTAQAHEVGVFGVGLLVPRAIHNGAGDTTAAGVTWLCPRDGDGGTVHWGFVDPDGLRLAGGEFTMAQGGRHAFVWASEGAGLAGQEGYLWMVADSNDDGLLDGSDEACIAGEAFHVNVTGQDVAYVQTWPFGAEDVLQEAENVAFDDIDQGPRSLRAGAQTGERVQTVFSVGGGDVTEVVLWSSGDLQGTHSVRIADGQGNEILATLHLGHSHLNVIDVGTLPVLPAAFTNGYMLWEVPATGDAAAPMGVAGFSLLQSPVFGAVQSVTAAHHHP